MKYLQQYIRKLLKESIQDPSISFENELYQMFEDQGRGFLAKKYPDGCEVRFKIEPTGGTDAYIHTIETVGDNCMRKGYARDTMESITAVADKYYVFLRLDAVPFGWGFGPGSRKDMPVEADLISFYESLGFVICDDHGIDCGDAEMERTPEFN